MLEIRSLKYEELSLFIDRTVRPRHLPPIVP